MMTFTLHNALNGYAYHLLATLHLRTDIGFVHAWRSKLAVIRMRPLLHHTMVYITLKLSTCYVPSLH